MARAQVPPALRPFFLPRNSDDPKTSSASAASSPGWASPFDSTASDPFLGAFGAPPDAHDDAAATGRVTDGIPPAGPSSPGPKDGSGGGGTSSPLGPGASGGNDGYSSLGAAADSISDPSRLCAEPLTHDSCRCPHLDAVLPRFLKIGRDMGPVDALHLAPHFGTLLGPGADSVAVAAEITGGGTGRSHSSRRRPFGDEQLRTDLISTGGVAEYFCPLLPPALVSGAESGGSRRSKGRHGRAQLSPTVSKRKRKGGNASSATRSLAGSLEDTAAGKSGSASRSPKPIKVESSSTTAGTSSGKKGTDKAEKNKGDAQSKKDGNTKGSVKAKVKKEDSSTKAKPDVTSSGVAARIKKERTVAPSISKSSGGGLGTGGHLPRARYLQLKTKEEQILKRREEILAAAAADGDGGDERVRKVVEAFLSGGGGGGGGGGGTGKGGKARDASPPRKGGGSGGSRGGSRRGSKSHKSAASASSKGNTAATAAVSSSPERGHHHRHGDDGDPQLRRLRRNRERDAKFAAARVEEWLDAARVTREAYWDDRRLSGSDGGGATGSRAAEPVGFGALNDGGGVSGCGDGARGVRCQWCPPPRVPPAGGGVLAAVEALPPTGDDLMRCLECSAVGCGPASTNPDSELCLMKHFLTSGHNLGITCGPRADLFCMRCGDHVYHDVFGREIERIDVARALPAPLGYGPSLLRRSYDPLAFVTTSDHGVLWRGVMAAYPPSVPPELVEAGRAALKRWRVFRGEVAEGGVSAAWGPRALGLALRQSEDPENSWRIPAPVGMYNLGQTCFMSSVLQCLVHCAPLQRFFLRDAGHHCASCRHLRNAAASSLEELNSGGEPGGSSQVRKTGDGSRSGGGGRGKHELDRGDGDGDACLACEMDRLVLECFGSAAGIDALSALEEPPLPASRLVEAGCSSAAPSCAKERGQPLVTRDLLTAIWRNAEMSHGYEQRDAHEFLQAFLDVVAKHARRTDEIARSMSDEASPSGINAGTVTGSASRPREDIVKHLFGGTLRSIHICTKCGYKRSQPELFLNVSLPLSKEVLQRRQRHAALSIEACLRHFTAAEELSDPVRCPSCEVKTTTRKQHSFAGLPRILCLHLKRFDAVANKKISEAVRFPARGLDMGPHLPHWCEVMQGRQTETETPDTASANSPQILYDLFATVNHTGSRESGHYMSNVKVGDKWYHCNDASVIEAGEKEVLANEGAYILFYKRR